MTSKRKLEKLIEKYNELKKRGALASTSEEDIRGWIDKFLEVFGWDMTNPLQVSKEKTLSEAERERLAKIGSTHARPDYTLKDNERRLCFVDAKNIGDDIFKSAEYAFQIRSYGFSIGAKISFLTNFEQLAVYDCTHVPSSKDGATVCQIYTFTIDEYLSKFEQIDSVLSRENLLKEEFHLAGKSTPVDEAFAKDLKIVRLEIGSELARAVPGISTQDLNFFTQTIINRILFIRVCEARNLEKDGILKDFKSVGFWESFSNSSYGRFYEKYDGPLFKNDDDLKKITIPDHAFDHFLSLLYEPSPYRFDVISLQSISDFYELFLGFQLNIGKNGNVTDVKKIDAPKEGTVTTPQPIVKQVIETALNCKKIEGHNVHDVLKLKLLDPACGSGTFLINAFDYLEAISIQNNSKFWKKKTDGHVKCQGRAILSIDGRKKIIENCLYGVDISREAVEVAKLSLSLRVIDGYDTDDFEKAGLTGSFLLQGIGENIKCGNTLVSDDIFSRYPAFISSAEEQVRTNVFNWDKEFPTIVGHGGFDFVIGNPPYVEVVNYNKSMPTMAQYIKEAYDTCSTGKIDLSIPFIHKSLDLLSNDGRLVFIVQKRFFKADYGNKLRELLVSSGCLNSVYDFEGQEVFDGLNTYVCILVCDKSIKNKEVQYINLTTQIKEKIPYSELSGIWSFENHRVFNLAENKKRLIGSVCDVANVSNGIQVLWDSAYRIKINKVENGIIEGYSKIDESIRVEEAACRYLVMNDKFTPFVNPEYKVAVIFPYVIENGKTEPIQFTEFCRRFPLAGAYLLKHKSLIESKVETVPKKFKKKDANEDWHLYTRCSHLEDNGLKVCVPNVSLDTRAAIIKDRDRYLDNSNIYYLSLTDNTVDVDKMYALTSIINSTVFSSFARCYAQPQSGGYCKFIKQSLQDVPFPVKAFNNNSPEIQELAELAKKLEYLNIEKEKKGTLGCRVQPSIDYCLEQIDLLCDSLYNFSPKEKDIVYAYKRKDRS